MCGIVGEADKVNANRRVYPTKEWRKNMKAAYDGSGSTGFMIGAVDHLGSCEGGNLKSSPIVWHKLEIQQDGLVRGEFDIADAMDAGTPLPRSELNPTRADKAARKVRNLARQIELAKVDPSIAAMLTAPTETYAS